MFFTTLRSWLGVRGPSRLACRGLLAVEALEARIQPATATVPNEVAIGSAVHYWGGDRQIDLDVRAHELVIGLTPGTGSLAPLIGANGPLADMAVSQWITSDLAILRSTSPTAVNPVAELNVRIAAALGVAGVAFAAPVYQNPATARWLVATNELVVALKPETNAQTAIADPRFASWEPLSGTSDQFIVRAAAGYGATAFDLNAQLQADPRFEWVTPNFYQDFQKYFTPNDSLYSSQWHLNNTGQYAGATVDADVDAPEAWDVTTGSQNVIVAVIDDGMEIAHPDLGPNVAINQAEIPAAVLSLLTDLDGDGTISFLDLNNAVNIGPGKAVDVNANGRIDPDDLLRTTATGGWADSIDGGANGYIDDLCGWDFTTNGTTGDLNPGADSTNDAHATSVAGVAVGVGNNALGTTGIAFRSRILPVRMFGSSGAATTDANIASAIYYSAGRTRSGLGTFRSGDIENHSWGGGSFSSAIQSAFQWASTNGRSGLGTTSFIASGNDSSSSVSFPSELAGSISGIVAVGASTDRETRATYSNYGPELDFVAPSSGPGYGGSYGIVTTDRIGANGYNTAGGASGDYTNTSGSAFGGTSSATPLSAGIGALILSANPNLTAAAVRGLMRNTTDFIGPASPAYDPITGFNAEFGYGRVNANAAVRGVGIAEIQVLDGRTDVPDNSGSIAFGNAYVGAEIARTLRVRNQGTLPLTLGTPTFTGPFELAAGFGSTTLNVGQSTTFVLRFRPSAVGPAAGTVSFATNDLNEGTFNFALTGTGLTPSLSGQTYEDWSGNATRDANDPATASRFVYLDQNGNGSYDAALPPTAYPSGTVNVAIPDNNATGITNNRTVSGVLGTVAKVTVTATITHPYVGDLALELVGPNGAVVSLANQRGGSGDNFTGTVFNDSAATAIAAGSAPFSNSYRPESVLAALNGISANGTWGLRVRDLGPADLGTLVNWTLTLTMAEESQTTTATGLYGFGGLPAGTYSVRTTVPAGWNATGPSGGVHTVTLAAGGSLSDLNFGSARQNAVYGQVIADLDGDGVRDAGEPGLGSWQVYDDRDNSGVPNGAEVGTASSANGNYVLTGLATGPTHIRLVPQVGFVNTIGAGGLSATLVANATNFNFDLGAVVGGPPPTADVIDVTPDPRYSAVGSTTITFSEAVTGFDLADLTLTRNGGPNLLTGAQTLASADSITWTLGNLSGLTAATGTYALTLVAAGSGIANGAPTLLAANASDSWQVVALPTVSIGDAGATEGASGSAPLSFAVTLSSAALETVTVSYSTADGSATIADGDYLSASGSVAFSVGESSKIAVANATGDATNEANETFFVNLTAPTNAVIGDVQGVGTIINDDPVPTLSLDSVSLSEGTSGTTAFTFTATLSAASGQTVTVNWATADGTALIADSDYQAASGTLSFAPGTTTQTFTVLVNGDTKNEATETFGVALSAPTNSTIAAGSGTGTITNDDAAPTLSIDSVALNEGNGGTTAFAFTVSLSVPSGLPVNVNFATTDGTATVADGDYGAAGGTLTFAPGTTSRTFTVLVNGDAKNELDESFGVALSGAANAVIGTGAGTGAILNDDAPPTLSIDSLSRSEGNGGTTAFAFTVSLSAASGRTVTVNFATADGSATLADGDYSSATGTLTFAPGITTQTITVLASGDLRNEAGETFAVVLGSATNAVISGGTGTGTIANDDPLPSLSINSVGSAEGNGGTAAFTFTVTLSAVGGQLVTVNYATVDGTATVADGDYIAAGGTLTFAPGTTTQTVTVFANGDAMNEANESFSLLLSGAASATISGGAGTGTIANDDPLPTLSIDSVALDEGDGGSTAFAFTVSLSAASGQTVAVSYSTADGTALAADGDYQTASGVLTFAPGTTTRSFTVQVNGDARNEADESFGVNLGSPSNATLAVSAGSGTIANDDPLPTLSIESVTRTEGNFGPVSFAFTVSLSAVSGQAVSVNFTTVDGSATAADGDYQSVAGIITFAPGITSHTITVLANGDGKNEAAEAFALVLGGASNATIASGTGTGTITNDDPLPTLSIDSVTQSEGNGGTTAFAFTVSLSAVSGQTITVNFATADGSALLADGDYQSAGGTLTFAPGITAQTFAVQVAGDVRNEVVETFGVALSGAANAAIAGGSGTGTIANDDPVPTLSIDSATLNEGNSGPTTFTFTVSLSAVSGQTVRANYATANGSATVADGDYSPAIGTLTFVPGTASQSITVLANGDTAFELNEDFRVILSASTNATIAAGTGTGTIANDDAVPTVGLSLVGSPFVEAGGTGTLTVSLSNPSYLPVSVSFLFAGSASPSDYTTLASAIVPAGQLSTTVAITGANDSADENDESVAVSVASATNGTIGTASSVSATITDNDQPAATADAIDLVEDVAFTALAGRLQSNDNAAPGSTVELVGPAPTNGSFTLDPNGSFTFTPNADFNGAVSFQYRVRNAAGEVSNAATATLQVAAVNDAPRVVIGPAQFDPRRAGPQVVSLWASGIASGPADESGQRLTFVVTTDRLDLFLVQPNIDPMTGTLSYTPTSGFGTAIVTVQVRDDGGTALQGSDSSAPQAFTIKVYKYQDDDLPTNQYEMSILAAGSGDAGTASAYSGDGTIEYSVSPFGGSGTRTATADVTGDGVAELIVATGPGVRSRVRIFDGVTQAEVRTLLPFEDSFTGGLFVAAADLDGDGAADIAVSPDTGGGGRVTVFSGRTGMPLTDFFGIDDASFRGGARVAFGDVNADGRPDLVVAAGFGGGPRIAIFNGTSLSGTPARVVGDFFGFPGRDATTLRNGSFVAAGDVDGDGFAELVLGGGPGGAPRVFVLSGQKLAQGDVDGAQAAPIANYFVADDTRNNGGVRVAVKDLDGDDFADVATGSGDGVASHARLYYGSEINGSSGEPDGFRDLDPFGRILAAGVFVG